MNIELARTFLEVISGGSLARAATRLGVTQSTVTMRIQTLEELLHNSLLVRNRSGVSMTAAGKRFYPLAETMLRTWQMTRRHMSLGTGFADLLSVGAASVLWDDLMFDWICNSRREKPEIAFRCESGRSSDLIERVFAGELDFCVVFEARSCSGFKSDFLFEDPLVAVSTEQRSVMEHWDPDYVEIEWDEHVKRQEDQFWPDVMETPHISTQRPELSIRFLGRVAVSL